MVGALVALLIFACASLAWISDEPVAVAHATPVPTPKPRANYREFPHAAQAHKMECSKCHKFPSDNWNKVRSEKDAFPDVTEYPRHDSCVGCHRQQFFRGATPNICSICHTAPGPSSPNRHPFPNPREIFDQSTKGKTHTSDFLPMFPHDKHIEIVAAHRSSATQFATASFISRRPDDGEKSCVVCHQTMAPQGKSPDEYLTKPPADIGEAFWLKKGTFKTEPTGHTNCFTCHSPDIPPAPSNCAACHQLKPSLPRADFDPSMPKLMAVTDKPMIDNWSRRYSSGTFAHEHFAHADLSCSTCHTVTKLNTADPATKKVAISACATCHATPKLDDGGVINYEIDQRQKKANFQCVKCHIALGKLPIPTSHTQAVKEAGATK
jgi:hypothetical protein